MAFKRMLASPLFNITKISRPTLTSSYSAVQTLLPPTPPDRLVSDLGDDSRFCLLRQWRSIYQSAVIAPDIRSFPAGEKLRERLRDLDIRKDRIRLDGLSPPSFHADLTSSNANVTVDAAKKLIKLSPIHLVKLRLRQMTMDHITYSELVRICSEECSSKEVALEMAETLGKSCVVIVLDDTVFLKPDKVMKVVSSLLPHRSSDKNDPRFKELEEMEKQKNIIENKAISLVRKELWFGLGYLIAQTGLFMKLTFSTLNWDVMEPICFYVTSFYFLACYAFFLMTSIEPSFVGFYQSRIAVKKKKLMKKFDFNVERYNELLAVFYPYSDSQAIVGQEIVT
ncbi:calcium uniporter protein 2, mitochondrial [Impatiens glandulifera]|uniref:calcium uniporter protein 2, mitochondrial n=1 Tax=Impatiens glandulifera TaxID=253017 RepID=UPI001FB0E138|nr:calcium uniporter protein 2, mitochondrial [Impatiens glandulifera]